ncbi:Non-histone chromosomal protein 6 [Coemansia biformis]|uniref:Non-histone chromosomal protein 6 n=1 Tax=Coemansia biformis TaxID=1286918 RepID=A0A9W7YI28_9FUNG|nr:Non-histone chromosomal protein 6 [Coemansia biformis]
MPRSATATSTRKKAAAAAPAAAPAKVSRKKAAATVSEGKVTKRRAKKDASAPKRPLAAYMFFSQAKRPTVQKENPNATFGEIGRLLGDMWKSMDDKAKKPYQELAAKDKVRYEAEKAAAAN